jgi:hypothetical protein
VGIRDPLARNGLSVTAEAAAAAAAAGRPATYRARIYGKRQGVVTNTASTLQAVAARAHDVWLGTHSNFTDTEWQVVSTYAAADSSRGRGTCHTTCTAVCMWPVEDSATGLCGGSVTTAMTAAQ